MKKILALAAAIVLLTGNAFAASTSKSVTLSYTMAQNIIFSLDLQNAAGTSYGATISTPTVTPDANGKNVEFTDLNLLITNNNYASYNIKVTCPNFVSTISPATNVLAIHGYSAGATTGDYIPQGTVVNLATVANLGTAGQVTLYTSAASELGTRLISLSLGTYVPTNALGGTYTSTITFVMTSL